MHVQSIGMTWAEETRSTEGLQGKAESDGIDQDGPFQSTATLVAHGQPLGRKKGGKLQREKRSIRFDVTDRAAYIVATRPVANQMGCSSISDKRHSRLDLAGGRLEMIDRPS